MERLGQCDRIRSVNLQNGPVDWIMVVPFRNFCSLHFMRCLCVFGESFSLNCPFSFFPFWKRSLLIFLAHLIQFKGVLYLVIQNVNKKNFFTSVLQVLFAAHDNVNLRPAVILPRLTGKIEMVPILWSLYLKDTILGLQPKQHSLKN